MQILHKNTKNPIELLFFKSKLNVGTLSLWQSVFWIKLKQLFLVLGLMSSILEIKTQSVLANDKKDRRMKTVLNFFVLAQSDCFFISSMCYECG